MKLKTDWEAPENWMKIKTIDAHTEGEPLRVIIGGFPEPEGDTILKKRRFIKENHDKLRTALMWEPRGHPDMYGCLITPAVNPGSDFGIIFMHNEGYSTMCGHGIIGVTTIVLETGIIPMKVPETTIKIDSPAGLVTAYAKVDGKRVEGVYFHNVPSFVLKHDEVIEVPGIGKVKYDVAFGGAFYAFVDVREVGLKVTPENYRPLIEKGMEIKRAIMENVPIEHPFEKDLNFLYGTIFIDSPVSPDADSRNVCIFADGQVDRCPTGTGVSARMAIHYMLEDIEVGEPMIIESIIGSRFTGRVIETTKCGPYPAVIPEVEGTARITGIQKFVIDPDDAVKYGFILR